MNSIPFHFLFDCTCVILCRKSASCERYFSKIFVSLYYSTMSRARARARARVFEQEYEKSVL